MTDTAAHQTKETLTSIMIAFVLAFVFRGFVLEAFIIPTGSMGPTLMGQHIRWQSDATGYNWVTGPWFLAPNKVAVHPQRDPAGRSLLEVHDPMSHQQLTATKKPKKAGDRLFILKYLHPLFNPSRFDVVVFKNPTSPSENYIKRLTGLPGEEIALVDGDVFHRDVETVVPDGVNSWSLDDWEIARKPERVQRELWRPVFDTWYTPRDAAMTRFDPPWQGEGEGWDDGWTRTYTYDNDRPTLLRWMNDRRGEPWWVTDRTAYNESRLYGPRLHLAEDPFPVSDIRIRGQIEAGGDGLSIQPLVRTRHHEFRATIADTRVAVEMRPEDGEWTTLDDASFDGLANGGRLRFEFWHVDQALWLFIDDRLVAGGPDDGAYDWLPRQRLEHALDLVVPERLDDWREDLTMTSLYSRPAIEVAFEGAPFIIHRIALDRDIHYTPSVSYERGRVPGFATHPAWPARLDGDEFFMCGDNSPNSTDARTWGTHDPWVRETLDEKQGVVNRDLIIGKAFFVYFPSVHKERGIPAPDFGRLRWIW
ncbi:MAG: hypothetical protein KDA28_02315 [Phycisphaerales bacterium]|nr:hypothetical protein [Phycisphaerales bacterium]